MEAAGTRSARISMTWRYGFPVARVIASSQVRLQDA